MFLANPGKKSVYMHIVSLMRNFNFDHMFDDIFGTCYIAEKEFFDKLNIDQGILRQIKANSESLKNSYIENINMSARFFDELIKMRISAIKSVDSYVHTMMESYANMLSQFNKSVKS